MHVTLRDTRVIDGSTGPACISTVPSSSCLASRSSSDHHSASLGPDFPPEIPIDLFPPPGPFIDSHCPFTCVRASQRTINESMSTVPHRQQNPSRCPCCFATQFNPTAVPPSVSSRGLDIPFSSEKKTERDSSPLTISLISNLRALPFSRRRSDGQSNEPALEAHHRLTLA